MVAANDTFPVPSKEIAEATTSPVIWNVLAVASFVAVVAVPVNAPINVVAVTTPETSTCLANKVVPVTVVIPANVETPATLN